MRNRAQYFFNAWYQPEYHMSREDWLYCAYMLAGANFSIGLGFLIGLLFW
jgi:hypothetical protein